MASDRRPRGTPAHALPQVYEFYAEVELAGWGARGRRRARVSAAIAAALDFQTWHLLARREGLGSDEVVDLMVGLVRGAARPAAAA